MQTIWGRITRRRALVETRREILATPDGDELVLDHLDDARGRASLHWILLHGLEGSSRSVYIQGLLSLVDSATVLNFRSCARPNRGQRLYHSGETSDFDFVLRTLISRMPDAKFAAIGASIGGNVLLKWLGEHPGKRDLAAAATISVPYDLAAGAAHIAPFYTWRFLRTLKQKARDVIARHPGAPLDLARTLRAKTFFDFDDAATAPLHGFRDAPDYYAQSSSIHFLGRITTPTLCVSAEDDPFLPRDVLDRAIAAASPAVEFVVTKHGGHTGFIAGRVPWKPHYWAEELVVDWVRAKIGA